MSEPAGEAPLFFYGTLMDPDLLGLVVGRPVAESALELATLAGWRRVRVRGASYPMLLPAPGERVEGRLWRHASAADLDRLDAYEGEGYRRVICEVELATGERLAAQVYLPRPGVLEPTQESWDLEAWRARFKPLYLGRGPDIVAADLP